MADVARGRKGKSGGEAAGAKGAKGAKGVKGVKGAREAAGPPETGFGPSCRLQRSATAYGLLSAAFSHGSRISRLHDLNGLVKELFRLLISPSCSPCPPCLCGEAFRPGPSRRLP